MRLYLNILFIAIIALCPIDMRADETTTTEAGSVQTPLEQLATEALQLSTLRENNHSLCAKLLTGEKTLTHEQSTVAILRATLRLQFKAEAHLELIDQERMRNIAFKGDLDSYAMKGGSRLLPQEQSKLNGYFAALRNYGRQQDKDTASIKGLIARLKKNIPRLPAPKDFTNELGIEMQLVSVKKFKPFYVSTAPVTNHQWDLMASRSDTVDIREANDDAPCDNIDFKSAFAFAQAVARFTGFKYTLPSNEQCAALAKVNFGRQAPVASWGSTPWIQGKYTNDADEEYALGRFDMTMVTIWDPAARLYRPNSNADDSTQEDETPLPLYGELPQACYPTLGIYLTAPLSAGTISRYNAIAQQVREELAEENATNAGEKSND